MYVGERILKNLHIDCWTPSSSSALFPFTPTQSSSALFWYLGKAWGMPCASRQGNMCCGGPQVTLQAKASSLATQRVYPLARVLPPQAVQHTTPAARLELIPGKQGRLAGQVHWAGCEVEAPLKWEHEDEMSRQMSVDSRREALEGRKSSLERECLQRPSLKAVSSCLREMTEMRSKMAKKK